MIRSHTRLAVFAMLVMLTPAVCLADAQHHLKKAQAYVRFRNYKRAVEQLKKALALEPDSTDIYFNIGVVAEKGRMWGEALLFYQGYLAMDPGAKDAKRVQRSVKGIIAAKLGAKAVKLTVSSTTPEVEFYLNNALIGKSPSLSVVLFPGRYALVGKKKDHHPFSQSLTLKAQEVRTVSATLKGIVYPGYIEVSTTPPGATVLLDGKNFGITPLKDKIKVVAKKRYLVTVLKPGYEKWVRYVAADKLQTAKVQATLSKK